MSATKRLLIVAGFVCLVPVVAGGYVMLGNVYRFFHPYLNREVKTLASSAPQASSVGSLFTSFRSG